MNNRPVDENRRKIKLLLVDDEQGYVDILSKRLAKRNFEVTKALSGTEGIKALRKQDFDVAVLDLKMEDMDGIEVLKIFKKMAPELSVIMLTGHGSEQAARDGLAHGAFDYLTKPCELEELIAKIHEACEGGKAGD
jgi:DNA-binding response OmpR family regulator|uniref:Response regulator n=1 Tax=Desulfomonile tiedjei TaxID=2358 RepID=A0A7C4ASU2_9BACT